MPIRWPFLERALAGAIFGLYMAHLLFFLNPQVAVTVPRLVTVTLIYGLICGLFFGVVLWAFRHARVRLFGGDLREGAKGFGYVALAAFIAAFIYWMHLSLLRIYLPIAAVRILSKATTLITGTAFALLVLWVFERNARPRISRLIVLFGLALIVISSLFLYRRHERNRIDRRQVVVASIAAVEKRQPVILVAIRNLPYDWIVTLKGEGSIPWLASATEQAYFTRLDPFPTTDPRALWASLATGKLPYRHGVTGRFSYRTRINPNEPLLLLPYGVGFRLWGLVPPVERISASFPAGSELPVWTIFQRLDLSARLVEWPFLPRGRRIPSVKIDPSRFNAAGAMKEEILDALEADIAALAAVDGRPAFTAVGLDGFSAAQRAVHIFLNEIPPRGTLKGETVRAYLQQIDAALADLAARNPDHVILLCSPSAVVPPPLPANAWALAVDRLRPEEPGADDGFLVVAGPESAHRDNPAQAQVIDVVPTLLFAAGLPVGRDMDGRILTDAFTDDLLRRSTLTAIQTYEAERLVVRGSSE
jgi:hypothetical protein